MATVRVWNDNVYEYREKFKDQDIKIPPHEYIEMDEDDAVMFRGTYSPPKLNVDGVHLPEGFKMIRIEKRTGDSSPAKAVDETKCLACSYKGTSKKDLEEHAKVAHKDALVVDPVAEKEIEERKKKQA